MSEARGRTGIDAALSEDGHAVLLRVKAVPGASGDQILGVLGDRLKVRVVAVAERGRANTAISAMLAKALGVAKDRVRVVRGTAHAEKLLRIEGLTVDAVRTTLGAGDQG